MRAAPVCHQHRAKDAGVLVPPVGKVEALRQEGDQLKQEFKGLTTRLEAMKAL